MSAQSGAIIFKPFVPKDQAQAHPRAKRARPKVPEEQRKRVRLSCETCRQKKEKCDGNVPCHRCCREATVCVPGTPSSRSRMSQNERAQRLQLILQHTLGCESLSEEELRTISDSLTSGAAVVGNDIDLHLGSSLSTFSHHLQQRLHNSQPGQDGNVENLANDANVQEEAVDAITEFCRSPSPVATSAKGFGQSALAAQPSKRVAEYLTRVYFDKVQCNSFQVGEEWAFHQVNRLYASPIGFKDTETTIVATLMMIMALGSQFCSESSLEPLGHIFYEQTIAIVPELIKRSDFESVRACLLLATYLFPVDHSGSAYTYLGLALHMATSKKMHHVCRSEVEVRVWWTLYTFYQRARIFHGHPRMLSYIDVTVRRPRQCAELEPLHGISNFDNQVALIEITITLENIADEITSLRRHRTAVHMANLLAQRRKLVDIKSQLPRLHQIANTARLRLDIHLCLFYWHARLYLGRPFLLEQSSAKLEAYTSVENAPAGQLFAQEAYESALAIVELCQEVHDRIGLSTASYVTEFTSCRAAMLVLVAKGITDRSTTVRDALAQGLRLIQLMSAGQNKASSETRVIAALERAITRLHRRPVAVDDTYPQTMLNENTKEWEMLWQQQSPKHITEDTEQEFVQSHCLGYSPEGLSAVDFTDYSVFDVGSTMFSEQLEEFSLFPLDEINASGEV